MKNVLGLISFLLIFYVCFSKVQAQNTSKLNKKAEKEFYNESFYNALGLYNESLTLKPDNLLVKYRVELCSLLVKDYRDKPLNTILEFSQTEGVKDRFYNYWLGRIYLSRYRFEEAVTAFEAFLELDVYKSEELIEIV